MINPQELAITIKTRAKSMGIPIKQLLSECDLGINALSSMQSGGYYPRLESLVKIAERLECSLDFLLGLTPDPTPATQKEKPVPLTEDGLSADEAALIQLFHRVPEDDRQMVLDLIRVALKRL